MAKTEPSDLIMLFKHKDKGYVWGECTTFLNTQESDMAKDFICATDSRGNWINNNSNLIELDSFTFSTSVDGSEKDDTTEQTNFDAAKKSTDNTHGVVRQLVERYNALSTTGPKMPVPDHPGYPGEKPEAGGNFAKWYAGGTGNYEPQIAPVEITRGIDKASPVLLKYCIDRTVLERATLIKRKAAGSVRSDKIEMSGEIYLRFDFETLLITKIDWDEDDPVKEKLSFISRAVTVSYRPQLPDGSLGAVVPGFFKTGPKYTPYNLKGK